MMRRGPTTGRHGPEEARVRFLLLLYVADRPAPGTPEAARSFAEIAAFHRACAEAGVLVDSQPLQPPVTATTVRAANGRPLRTDGPYAETKEWLGGYFLLDCPDREAALAWADRCPTARDGSVEVRPVIPMPT
jgi:hypothetical protein